VNVDLKDPTLLRWAGAVLVVLVIVPMYFLSTMYPVTYASRQGKVRELQTRHEELERDLEKARLLVRNLERVEREYQILHDQWEVASSLLPEQNEMPALLRKVTAAGKQSGVEFTMFRPEATRPAGFYTDNPVAIKIEGGFHETGVFLSRLANLDRIVNVGSLKLEGVPDQSQNPLTVTTELTLTAYTLDGGGAAAGEDAGDGRVLTGTEAKGASAGGAGGTLTAIKNKVTGAASGEAEQADEAAAAAKKKK
jgi:type IV pilus assembly protein PilO